MCTNDLKETLKLHFSTESGIQMWAGNSAHRVRDAQSHYWSTENQIFQTNILLLNVAGRAFPQVSCCSWTKRIKQQHNTQIQVFLIKYSRLWTMQACYYWKAGYVALSKKNWVASRSLKFSLLGISGCVFHVNLESLCSLEMSEILPLLNEPW